MKIIGMIGGAGWPSTLEYYRIINQETNRRLGGLNSAKIILSSFNYGEIDLLNKKEDHAGVYELVLDAAQRLKKASVDFLIICANTMHQYVDALENETGLKIVHIADATAKEIKKNNITTIGLLGTRFTMEMDFYKKRFNQFGIETLVPEKPDRDFIHAAIMNELLKGQFKAETKNRFMKIIDELENRKAEGIVLGCTEIPLLINQDDVELPVFNTLEIHALAAVDFALS
jgi:aspartate racemase